MLHGEEMTQRWSGRTHRLSQHDGLQVPALEEQLLLQLIPRDEADDRDVILEVRAGTGGDEASLFAGDLIRMYQRFAQLQGWRFEFVEVRQVICGNFNIVTGGGMLYLRVKASLFECFLAILSAAQWWDRLLSRKLLEDSR